jgi:hydrogenase maturation protein HypF
MPYDRDKTSMNDFKLCHDCNSEFIDPLNRRMHAQTISCPTDGPVFSLFTKGGRQVPSREPIKDFARELDAGAIGIVKSWGGMHIVSILDEIVRLRQWYKRPEKPFAVMARDLEAAEKYSNLDAHTEALLKLPERPIVLVPKRNDLENFKELELVSPGLDSIGMYLPYSAIQYLLFEYLKHDALVMTSANPRGEPLVVNNTEAFDLDLDVYLLHNREIINRVDDSLIIPYTDKYFFIRRSRGFVPVGIDVDNQQKILAVGAESNVTTSLSKSGKLYTSQYIGNTNYYRTSQFLSEAAQYLMRLLGIKELDAIALDLHPQYPTRKLAMELAEECGSKDIKTFEIQHHWAHAASLMLDAQVHESIIALSIDGAGYGSDKTVWGGEVLNSRLDAFDRLGSLELLPLIGGDKAVYEPQRLVIGVYECLGLNSEELKYFPEGTYEVFRKMMPQAPQTSSFGRVLDTLSCYFGIGTRRTYDGEPAMKLERYLAMGNPSVPFNTNIETQTDASGLEVQRVQTLPMFKQLFEHVGSREPTMLDDEEKANLCNSFVSTLVQWLMKLAVQGAKKQDINYLGVTGGVSYNLPINDMIKKEFESNLSASELDSDCRLLTHSRLPNGDGGISAGQNVIAGTLLNKN